MDTIPALLAAADRCVKCALCLPHCPTYQLYTNENESPRGRIALAEGVLSGQLPMDSVVQNHLDHCVLCQRCETVCPSQVEYGRLLEGIRQHIPNKPHWSQALLHRPAWLTRLTRLATYLPRWQRWPLSIRLAQALGPHTRVPKPGVYTPIGRTSRGRVGLFLGCATQAMQANALHASLLLLRSLGYTVVIPSGQHCCGALATHQGNRALAADLTTKNQALFTDQVDTILSIASGCTAGSPLNLVDILTFLAEDSVCRALPWRVWSDTSVSLHLPCTLRNVLAADTKVIRLLQRIPGLEWNHLEGSCCGAAGDHLLRQRTQAVALRKPLLAQLQESQADCVLTTNIGCALHLAEGMQQLKQPIQVWHPVELLVRCLPIGP